MMGMDLLCICLVILVLYIPVHFLRRRSASLPPGPSGWPLIGNIFDFQTHAPYKKWSAMRAAYGPVMTMNVLGTQYVVLNSLEATRDLLDKKSATTSNRPCFTMASELVGWRNSTGFLQYGDIHRKHRKFLHQQIGTRSSLEGFYPTAEAEARRFVRSVLKNPDGLAIHAHRTTSSFILKLSYGYTVKESDDLLVELSSRAMRNVAMTTSPGCFLVDLLPFLRYLPEWLPGCGFIKDAKRWRQMATEAVNRPHEFVLERLAKGEALPSFTSRLLQQGVTPEEEELLKWASFSMYIGGSDTIMIMLSAFFLAMTLYPEVLKKAQAEIDAVVGHERLPIMQDWEMLPYVGAICEELLRWHVAVPLTMHVTTQDEFYNGYLIPKGSHVLGNIWAVLSDPKTYPNPEVFDPERYLCEYPQPDPREACFGNGRRICPGVLVVEMIMFICIATALATLDVSRCVENGVECVPMHDVEEGTVRYIKPFKFIVTPRSNKAKELLRIDERSLTVSDAPKITESNHEAVTA